MYIALYSLSISVCDKLKPEGIKFKTLDTD